MCGKHEITIDSISVPIRKKLRKRRRSVRGSGKKAEKKEKGLQENSTSLCFRYGGVHHRVQVMAWDPEWEDFVGCIAKEHFATEVKKERKKRILGETHTNR